MYLARLKGTAERFALKCLNISELGKHNLIARIQNEVKITSMFSASRHVANLFDYFEEENHIYLVMEYVENVEKHT